MHLLRCSTPSDWRLDWFIMCCSRACELWSPTAQSSRKPAGLSLHKAAVHATAEFLLAASAQLQRCHSCPGSFLPGMI